MPYFDTHIRNTLVVDQNKFRTQKYESCELPKYHQSKKLLPKPFWDGHDSVIECYWKVWELAFKNLRKPTEESGFIANFIDSAFNNHLYMWDSGFIMLFAHYGCRAFNFQQTLDNLYAKQHLDGFICREVYEDTGEDAFERFDAASTGPNILPWVEWEYYLRFGDSERLRRVFPVLLAYHRWLRSHRTWPDGSYWLSGFASGMDNQPRQPEGYHTHFSHGHMSWIDACSQQVLSAKMLNKISEVIERWGEVEDLRREAEILTKYINEKMWDEETGFYYDRWSDGRLSGVKTVGAYWTLLASIVPEDRVHRFVMHLENENEFNRPHRVTSLSHDHPKYDPFGDYWKGSVWSPTNYMVISGLRNYGYHQLAYDIALNHLQNVVKVFADTETLWENYAPERIEKGNAAKADFVGWSGLPPVAILFEDVFGIRTDVHKSKLVWSISLLEKFGIENYPFGNKGTLNLKCEKRSSEGEKPVITVEADFPLELEIRWKKGTEVLHL